jgi:hypothetical protein
VRIRLSPPKAGTWLVAVLLGLVAILLHWGPLSIRFLNIDDFWLLAFGFALLVLGTLFRGL